MTAYTLSIKYICSIIKFNPSSSQTKVHRSPSRPAVGDLALRRPVPSGTVLLPAALPWLSGGCIRAVRCEKGL